MPRKRKTEYSIMLQSGDEECGGMQLIAFDDDQPVCSETLINLVAEWADLESLDGELHPYLDSTLNLLSDMTYALVKAVERMEQDDPHRQALHQLYVAAYQYVQGLVTALEPD
jgi:hypothetical protein